MSTAPNPPVASAEADGTAALRALVSRWFVEFNPMYLLSAALVLGGCILWSRGLAQEDSLVAPLGVALVAEMYAACLIGGVALLVRIGLRRPAVMLALLSVVYQWDSTLHTETSAYLGSVGAWATAAWVVLFAAKLASLSWALRVRFDARGVVAAFLGAAGLAIGPRVLPGLGARNAGALLAVWAFTLVALYHRDGIESLEDLDAWGRTVLRRATVAAWLMSGAVLELHVFMWWKDHEIALLPAFLVFPLVRLRRIRTELHAWAVAGGTLALAALVSPPAVSVTALLAAAALLLRAYAPRFATSHGQGASPQPVTSPYRAAAAPVDDGQTWAAAVTCAAERGRAVAGALFAVHLATWTSGWTSGPFPQHILALDVLLGAAVVVVVWRTRVCAPLLPLVGCYAHLVVQARLVPLPASMIGWGEAVVASGFALLAGSLAVTVWAQRYAASEDEPDPDTA